MTLILLIHVYTFGIGYLVHLAIKRRKVYLERQGGKGEGLPMHNPRRSEKKRENSGTHQGRGGFSLAVLKGKIWTDGDEVGDDGKAEALPMYTSPNPPSPYSDSNSYSISLLNQGNPDHAADWEEWGSDNDSAGKFGWEDQTPKLRPSTSNTNDSQEANPQTWKEATRSFMGKTEGWGVPGLIEKVKSMELPQVSR